MAFEPIPAAVEQVATEVIGAAIEVHRHLGPGFLERIYQEALCMEMTLRKIHYQRECAVVVRYKRLAIAGQRIDLIAGDCIVIELKAATKVDLAHDAKVISYLRTTGFRLGLLLNFNCRTMKEGVKRIVL